MGGSDASHGNDRGAGTAIHRREFLKAAAAAAAAGALSPGELAALGIDPGAARLDGLPSDDALEALQQAQVVALGNGEPPALQFQAYPGGTGALLEKLWREHGGIPFEPAPIDLQPWVGPVPTDEVELAFLPAHRLGALIRARHVTAVELTEIYLERLRRYDPLLLCAVTILEGRGREEAQQADAELRAGTWRGPLHGVPYGIKDVFAVAGARTTWGSDVFRDQVLDFDSEIVVRLREAGAVLVAKLATGEFAQGDVWYRGRTRNPWNVAEGSSGSSAGPGSATAAGLVGFSIGTETQGSIVSPSRQNGLSALRPTHGRISRHGGMVLSWSMDKPGPMCRSIEDCAHVFQAIHGSDEKDPGSLTAPFRFERNPGISRFVIGYTPDAPPEFLEALTALGARLKPMPELPNASSNAIDVESAAAFEFLVASGRRPDQLAPNQQQPDESWLTRFTRGRTVSAVAYLQSQRRRYLFMKEMERAMTGFDMFVSGSGHLSLTNATGHPSVVVPYGFGLRNPYDESPTEMPLTTTLIGSLFADDAILSVAHAYQRTTDWHQRRPNMNAVSGAR